MASERSFGAAATAATAILVVAALTVIYGNAAASYFFNDDFQWLAAAYRFRPANLLHLEHYNHFYRPVIEIYFFIGRSLFGCAALPFHLSSLVIHVLNTAALFRFAHVLMRRRAPALVTAALFAVQPGPVEAVAWVAAITELLAASWYLLALWLHLLFLERGGRGYYIASAVAFAACLFTHEISSTLLPVMIALEILLMVQAREQIVPRRWRGRLLGYLPFAMMLLLSLGISAVVNSRSYLIREGHYAVGWHAVPHIIQYVLGLVVWERNTVSYLVVPGAIIILAVLGTPRQRFALFWMLLTLLPPSFFTWGNASRYLYLPAAAFSLLLADLLSGAHDVLLLRLPLRAQQSVALAVAAGLALRFAAFAHKAAADFPSRTLPYERFALALQQAGRSSPGVVELDRTVPGGLPPMYLNPAAEVVFCAPDIHVVVR